MVWKEVEVLRELSWPTVLHIVDAWWGEGAKALYMLLPAFGGGPLAKQVEAAAALRRPIALERIADWYAQTLHAVSYLHWCGVVHRDVKAENLLLQSSGHTLCLGDLGSAELLPDASPEACVKVSMTTPKITPPEVFLAGLHYAASDMWAVAATFCEVALLEPPLDVSIVDHEAVFQVAGLEPRLQDALAACARCSPGECPGGAPATDVLCAEMGQELRSMLQQDPRHRPSAASLVAGRRVYQRLQFVLRGAMPPEETDRHFQRLDQVIEESAQRPLAGPP
ncbi:unnamed protein product [Prorocentrum cordatum]|uniref:non-specific serine/threonine protein kinase n=1 Tax=Prorocentrum cordatum TaxID=2364126 RepID=A0ABN9XBY9_9DINO|nr:unnamed protein product [Polarella glacialis]